MKPGFTYTFDWFDQDGIFVCREIAHNLLPLEGLNHLLNVAFKGGTQVASWYIAPYEGNYVPVMGDTAATFPASAVECTAYDETLRVAFVSGTPSGGALDNSSAPAMFTFNANKTLYGAFMVSAAAKGATSGTLISAVKFSSPKPVESGYQLKVTAGFIFASA